MKKVLFLLFSIFSLLCGGQSLFQGELFIQSEFLNPFSGAVFSSDCPAVISVENLQGERYSISQSDTLAPLFLSYVKEDSSHFGSLSIKINSEEIETPLKLVVSTASDSADVENIAVDGKKYVKHSKLPDTLNEEIWGGTRSKFWTTLIKPADTVSITYVNESQIELTLSGSSEFTIYSGPVDRASLKNSENEDLSALLYYELWPWVRLISIGLQKLLYFFVSIVKSYGLAIILLSLFVKIAMYPLVKIADRWQDEVNRTKSLLQPKIDEINKEYKGEEQHNRVMALYKEHSVSPFYTIKSLAGFFIQIPVFFAAYHTLGEELSLKGFSFLWINDLALQDRLFELPFSILYFGNYFNMLPLLMTVITVLSAYIHTDESLSPPLLKKQRINLYSMAFLFFVLFYHFPAAMVSYWTMNNVSAFVKAVYLKFIKPKRV